MSKIVGTGGTLIDRLPRAGDVKREREDHRGCSVGAGSLLGGSRMA